MLSISWVRAFEVEFADGVTRVGHIGSWMRLLSR